MIALSLPASEIPIGTEVRKPTGQKRYVLKDKIEVRGEGGQTLYPDNETLFLVCVDSIYCINKKTILSIDLSLDEAIELLVALKEGNHE